MWHMPHQSLVSYCKPVPILGSEQAMCVVWLPLVAWATLASRKAHMTYLMTSWPIMIINNIVWYLKRSFSFANISIVRNKLSLLLLANMIILTTKILAPYFWVVLPWTETFETSETVVTVLLKFITRLSGHYIHPWYSGEIIVVYILISCCS